MIEAIMTHPDILRMEKYGELNPEEAIYTCDICGEEIYEGDDYYSIEGDYICTSCIDDFRKTAEIDV